MDPVSSEDVEVCDRERRTETSESVDEGSWLAATGGEAGNGTAVGSVKRTGASGDMIEID